MLKNPLPELFSIHTTWDTLFLRRLPRALELYWRTHIQLHVNNDFMFASL